MKNRGFTLIELMIVVAIIGIIAAIVLPLLVGGKAMVDSQSGTSVQHVDSNTPSCVNGLVMKNGEPITRDGVAVRC